MDHPAVDDAIALLRTAEGQDPELVSFITLHPKGSRADVNLGEALRRISEGAAFIRTKGEAGTGNVVEAVRHQRAVMAEIRKASAMSDEELYACAKEISAPFHLLKEVARLKRLPVVSFAAGGIATPGMYFCHPDNM